MTNQVGDIPVLLRPQDSVFDGARKAAVRSNSLTNGQRSLRRHAACEVIGPQVAIVFKFKWYGDEWQNLIDRNQCSSAVLVGSNRNQSCVGVCDPRNSRDERSNEVIDVYVGVSGVKFPGCEAVRLQHVYSEGRELCRGRTSRRRYAELSKYLGGRDARWQRRGCKSCHRKRCNWGSPTVQTVAADIAGTRCALNDLVCSDEETDIGRRDGRVKPAHRTRSQTLPDRSESVAKGNEVGGRRP